jgi:hypothetical protein
MRGTLHKAGLGGEVPRAVELRAGVAPQTWSPRRPGRPADLVAPQTGSAIMTSDRLRCRGGRGMVVL